MTTVECSTTTSKHVTRGDYHQSTSGNYYCVTKTGVGGCNPQGDCSYNPSGPAPKPGAPTLLQVVGTVGVAG
jgi:hypothetical protein